MMNTSKEENEVDHPVSHNRAFCFVLFFVPGIEQKSNTLKKSPSSTHGAVASVALPVAVVGVWVSVCCAYVYVCMCSSAYVVCGVYRIVFNAGCVLVTSGLFYLALL